MHNQTTRGRLARAGAVAALVAGSALVFATPAQAAEVPGYDSIPGTLAGNYPSQGFEATSTNEFGDVLTLDPAALADGRVLSSVRVVFSSWACETGGGVTCATTPGASFTHPITANVYTADGATKLATVTQNVTVPYRPSAEPLCAGGTAWSADGGTTCFNGYAFPVSFDFGALTPEVVLPSSVLVTVEYDTANRGYAPTGVASGADSLNVAVRTPSVAPTVGTNAVAGDIWLYGTNAVAYGDGGALNVLRADASWTGYDLLAELNTELPTLAPVVPAAGPTGPTLAATGGKFEDLAPWGALALGVVALGVGGVVYAARRRVGRHVS